MTMDTKEEYENIELQRKRAEIVSAILAKMLVSLGVTVDPDIRGTDLILAAQEYLEHAKDLAEQGYTITTHMNSKGVCFEVSSCR